MNEVVAPAGDVLTQDTRTVPEGEYDERADEGPCGDAPIATGRAPCFGELHQMLTRDYVERELSHIQRMVALLESDTGAGDVVMPCAMRVSRPSYWRGRIEALLVTPGLPRDVRRLGDALLEKIGGMESRVAVMK
nr:hypothetical protein [Burkholderia anthina]